MKKLRNLLFLALSFILAFGVYKLAIPHTTENNFSANAESVSVMGEQVPDYPLLDYVSLSMRDKKFDYTNMKATFDETRYSNRTDRSNVNYIVSVNDAFSINFKPLEFRYSLSYSGASNYSVKTTTIPLKAGAESFEYEGITYYFRLYTRTLNIYRIDPASSSAIPIVYSQNNENELIKFTTDAYLNENTNRYDTYVNEIILTNSITLNSDSAQINGNYEYPVSIGVYTTSTSTQAQQYTLTITKPAITFANNEEAIANFASFKIGGYSENDNWLKPEQSFNRLELTFLSNKYNYSENNPLYFNINYNGFVYTFNVYSKIYGTQEYLFVNYSDSSNEDPNKRLSHLATELISHTTNGNIVYEPDPNNSVISNNNFTMTFEKRGRYEIEFYDNTHLLGSSNANYYSTSFYVKDDSGTVDSAFENIYIIAEANKSDGSSEYIVNTSIQNFSVKSTIKNLIDETKTNELKDVIKYIEISKTLYGSSDNITTYEYYIPTGSSYTQEILNLKTSHPDWDINIYEDFDAEDKNFINNNGDFSFLSEADGYYEIAVHKVSSSKQTKDYNFTIVTQAKATFTVDGKTLEASEPYKTQPSTHTKQIQNNDKIAFSLTFSSNPTNVKTPNIDKTYINSYTVLLGRQLVTIEADIGKDYITFNCQGVGDMLVEITFNGETVPYSLNSEDGNGSVTFYDYGTYTVKITDSMGTTDIQTFSLTKKLNTSAILLIVFAGVILLAVVTFVIISRAKPKTR